MRWNHPIPISAGFASSTHAQLRRLPNEPLPSRTIARNTSCKFHSHLPTDHPLRLTVCQLRAGRMNTKVPISCSSILDSRNWEFSILGIGNCARYNTLVFILAAFVASCISPVLPRLIRCIDNTWQFAGWIAGIHRCLDKTCDDLATGVRSMIPHCVISITSVACITVCALPLYPSLTPRGLILLVALLLVILVLSSYPMLNYDYQILATPQTYLIDTPYYWKNMQVRK